MSAPEELDPVYPRPISDRERSWCDWLLPRDRAAYRALGEAIDRLSVIGIGRWGDGDFVLGVEGQQVDLEAPMEPVAAYGEITFEDRATLSLSIHQLDDEARIEMHVSGPALGRVASLEESSRWCYSYWKPGEPTPSGGPPPRQVRLDENLNGSIDDEVALVLAIDATRRVMWLHDGATLGNTLIPVTNFYNELMLVKGVRDPAIALQHRRLFEATDENTDRDLRTAFRRYNVTWRKVDADRLGGIVDAAPARSEGVVARIMRTLHGGDRR